MLSYEALRRIFYEEKSSHKMTDLPEGFFDDVKAYLHSKAKMSGGDSWEYESAKLILQDLLERRETKLVNLALFHLRSGADPGKMTPEEREFFDSILSASKGFQARMKEIMDGKREPSDVLGFLENVPEFVGTDEKHYGPFKKGDLGSVPSEVAAFLVSKGMARKIDPETQNGK